MEDQIGNKIEDVSNTHIAKELRFVQNELKWLKEIHLTSDSKEESSDEECLYTAFVEGVSDIGMNRTVTSSSLPTAHTALATHAHEKEDNKKEHKDEPGPSHKTSEPTTDTTPNLTVINTALNDTLGKRETKEAVRWIEENQETWLKKPHLVPLLDSSKEWEAITLSEIMVGETSLMNNGQTN